MSKKHKTYTTEFKAEAIKLIEANQGNVSETARLIYAELSGDFPLGDSRQPTYKSLRPFDLVS